MKSIKALKAESTEKEKIYTTPQPFKPEKLNLENIISSNETKRPFVIGVDS